MLDVARDQVQTIHAVPGAGVDTPDVVFHDAEHRVAGQAAGSVVRAHAEWSDTGVLHQSEPGAVGTDPQSPALVDKQCEDRGGPSIRIRKRSELPAVVAKYFAAGDAPQTHPDVAVVVLGKSADQPMSI